MAAWSKAPHPPPLYLSLSLSLSSERRYMHLHLKNFEIDFQENFTIYIVSIQVNLLPLKFLSLGLHPHC